MFFSEIAVIGVLCFPKGWGVQGSEGGSETKRSFSPFFMNESFAHNKGHFPSKNKHYKKKKKQCSAYVFAFNRLEDCLLSVAKDVQIELSVSFWHILVSDVLQFFFFGLFLCVISHFCVQEDFDLNKYFLF